MGQAKIEVPLDAKEDLESIADDLLKRSGVYGVVPTPLDEIAKFAGVKCENELPEQESFLKTLTERGKKTFLSAKQTLRGIADLRDKVVYIPQGQSDERERFAYAHELAHQSIEWHDVNDPLMDTQYNFSPDIKKTIEREANYLGAELLYQGDHFKNVALDHAASISSALKLAEDHRVSKHATLIKLTQVQDERICVAEYYPIQKRSPSQGFRLTKTTGSSKFNAKLSDVELPATIFANHDWYAATEFGAIPDGTIQLPVDGQIRTFEWSAWFNQYCLFVMLRDKPTLHKIGGIIRPIRNLVSPSRPPSGRGAL